MPDYPQADQTQLPSCRLPFLSDPMGEGWARTPGFITLPSGGFTPDSAGVVTNTAGGYFGATWDPQFSRWVTVPPTSLTPDGAHYVYESSFGSGLLDLDVTVVDVATGVPSHVPNSHGMVPSVVDNGGFYFRRTPFGPQIDGYLSFTGRFNKDVVAGSYLRLGREVAYRDVTTGESRTRLIQRIDLKTSAVTDWWTGPGDVYIVDRTGAALILTDDGRLLRVTKPGQSQEVIDASVYLPGSLLGDDTSGVQAVPDGTLSAFADDHGIWIGSLHNSVGEPTRAPGGLYLYTERAGLMKVSSLPGQPAGPCS
jgi:hypothetical protein